MAKPYVFNDLSGGRNNSDAPLSEKFAPNQVVDAVNVDWYRTSGARKRNGLAAVGMTGSPFAGIVSWLGRFVPAGLDTDAELWGLDEWTPAHFARLDNSATWTSPAGGVQDLPIGNYADVTCASLNGLFFLAYHSAVNRLHVYDPNGQIIRRTGMSASATFTVANHPTAGTYPAVPRWYRVRFFVGGISRISEPTPAVQFTPSGASVAARITLTLVPSEGETGWYAEGSADGVTFYVLGPNPMSQAIFDDVVAPSAYSAGQLSPLTGTYGLQKAYRFIAADSNRLVGFGSYVVGDRQNRIEVSAVVGSRDESDAERLDTTSTYYYDLDEKDSGAPTGLFGPLFGNFYPTKARQIWEMTPTGVVSSPYRLTPITKELGCVGGHGAAIGEDESGNPCLYIMTHRGVYRYGAGGLTYISRGIEDLLLGPTSVINFAATNAVAHLVYHPDKRQLWVWFATGTSNDPNTLCVLNVQTSGWARYTGILMTQARCSVMFARAIGATMGYQMAPYTGVWQSVNAVVRLDEAGVSHDNGVPYQAFVVTRPIEVAGTGMKGGTGDVQVLAPAVAGVTLTISAAPDFGAVPGKTGTVVLTSRFGEARVSVRAEDTEVSDAEFVQFSVGDGSPLDQGWTIDRLTVPVTDETEPVS